MQPGDAISQVIYRRTAAGLPSPGKVTADFTIAAWLDGVAASVAASITELTDSLPDRRAYKLAYTLPATRGQFALVAVPTAPSTDIVWPDYSGEIETNDLDALYNVLVVPIVSIVSLGGPQGDIRLRVVNGDYAPVSFTVKDQAGAVIPLNGYNNAKFRVWNKTQTTVSNVVPYEQATGITMTAGGLVTIGIPETAATHFYGLLTPAGTDSVTAYWQFVADEAADATKTRTLARGSIEIVRKEVA